MNANEIALTITPHADFVSPCGCLGCEKWADCDYCGTCSPEATPAEMAAEAVYWREQAENAMSFSNWLLSR